MGRLYEQFGSLSFRNEAEVSQNFILPLLLNYLGYSSAEVIPEKYYPAKDIFSGVKFSDSGSKALSHRPDFVVCINGDTNEARFIIDSKGPKENIDSHFGQLRSYAISVNRNLLLMTNGLELKVYDVNNLLFHSKDIADLQSKIILLDNLIGRSTQAIQNVVEIIKNFDYESAVDISSQMKLDKEVQRKQLLLSDFKVFLQNIYTDYANWHLPTVHFQALSNLDLRKIDPNYLLTFKVHTGDRGPISQEKLIKLPEIETDRGLNIKVFSGETGAGKSCLLRFLTFQAAQNCLSYREVRIPVFVSLRDIGHGYKLEDLIVSFLNQNGYHCTSFYDLPDNNDFVFFLDAYDEITEEFLDESFQAIERLSNKFECYLTTRPHRIPSFASSTIFDVLPISGKQVEEIIRKHIINGYYEFQQQIENNNLRTECGNVLLLLFFISLFKESGRLPNTVTRIVSAVVERIKVWQNTKHKHGSELDWYAIEQLMAALAFRLMELNDTSLSKSESESIILIELQILEQKRRVKPGLTIQNTIKILSETGLVIINNDHLYFWHRLLFYHFSACGLKSKYEQNPLLITDIIAEDRWHVAIEGVAAQLSSITKLIKDTKSNLWLSAYCLAENSNCDKNEVKEIADRLHDELHSAIAHIRRKAAIFLAQIDHPYVKEIFFRIPDGNYAKNVRILALSVIGKTKTPEAKNILYKYLDWDDSDFFFGPSAQANIARGLYYYNEEEHQQIIENWKKSRDWWMDEECRKIFLDLQAQGKLTEKLITSLEQLFISELSVDPSPPDKMRALAKILAHTTNETFAEKIIDMSFNKTQFEKLDAVCDILKEYKSPAIIQLIKNKILEINDQEHTAESIIEALTENSNAVPKEIFYELSNHSNLNVASKAIYAFRRFPYPEVKDQVEKYLYGEHPQLQSWALDVLVDNGEIVHFIRTQEFPKQFYTPAAYNLLKAVRKYHLVEATPLMERIFKALSNDIGPDREFSLAFDLAGTYYFMGLKEKHNEILGWFFDGTRFLHKWDTIHFHLLKHIQHFDPALSLKLAECYFNTYYPFKGNDKYKMNYFLEATEKLGLVQLVPLIKKIADLLLSNIENGQEGDDHSKYNMERPLRALVWLVQVTDEDWLLERIGKLDYGMGLDFPQFRRTLECLANAGTVKSLPYIKKIAKEYSNESLLNVCYVAYERICMRHGISFNTKSIFETG